VSSNLPRCIDARAAVRRSFHGCIGREVRRAGSVDPPVNDHMLADHS
jgi:hypothetical protein